MQSGKRTREEMKKHWAKYPNAHTYIGNFYRTSFLIFQIMIAGISKEDSILEIGCGVGRNLDKLITLGYTNLLGIDISEKAVQLMRENYPRVYHNCEITQCDIADYQFQVVDWVITLACFEHIPFECDSVFEKVAQHCKKGIITIEDELGRATTHFARNYSSVFRPYGFIPLSYTRCTNVPELGKGFFSRVMIRGNERNGLRIVE